MITVSVNSGEEEAVVNVVISALRSAGYGINAVDRANVSMVSTGTEPNGTSQTSQLVAREVVEVLQKTCKTESSERLYAYVIETVEKPLIEHALVRTGCNQVQAARLLGVNRNTLRAKIKKLSIALDDLRAQSKRFLP